MKYLRNTHQANSALLLHTKYLSNTHERVLKNLLHIKYLPNTHQANSSFHYTPDTYQIHTKDFTKLFLFRSLPTSTHQIPTKKRPYTPNTYHLLTKYLSTFLLGWSQKISSWKAVGHFFPIGLF